jgi:hypothetical protein
MEFENVSSQKSGRSIVIDFQMVISIHTSLYVKPVTARRVRSHLTLR